MCTTKSILLLMYNFVSGKMKVLLNFWKYTRDNAGYVVICMYFSANWKQCQEMAHIIYIKVERLKKGYMTQQQDWLTVHFWNSETECGSCRETIWFVSYNVDGKQKI